MHIDDVQQDERNAWSRKQINFPKLTIFINECPRGYQVYRVTGHIDELDDPKLKFRVYLMDLTREDNQKMQFDSKHIPNPVVGDQRSAVFHLQLGLQIVYVSYLVKLLVCRLISYQLSQACWKRKTSPCSRRSGQVRHLSRASVRNRCGHTAGKDPQSSLS
jgi:hypothetical protein